MCHAFRFVNLGVLVCSDTSHRGSEHIRGVRALPAVDVEMGHQADRAGREGRD